MVDNSKIKYYDAVIACFERICMKGLLMTHQLQRQYRDYSGELSTATVNVTALTVVTLAAQLILMSAMDAAMDGISLGEPSQSTIIMDRNELSGDLPASPYAQRELKWLVHYHGNVNNGKYTAEIPCAKAQDNLIPGTDRADLTSPNMSAFVTAWEELVMVPGTDTETTTIDYIELVGRNL